MSVPRDILERPWDDGPRLVYADELEEAGDVRGEFIRAQVELSVMKMRGQPAVYSEDDPDNVRCNALRSREREILAAHAGDFTGLPYEDWAYVNDFGRLRLGEDVWHFSFSRGFVRRVNCSWWLWREHGPQVLLQHPVEEVWLMDRRPFRRRGQSGWAWYPAGVHGDETRNVPLDLWPLLRGTLSERHQRRSYRTQTAAERCLSLAAVTWAREKAGLCIGPPQETSASYSPFKKCKR